MEISVNCTTNLHVKYSILFQHYSPYLSVHGFEGLPHARPPPPQALTLLTSSEASTPVLLECSAALTGKWPLCLCKVASTAGGHLVGAVADSIDSALIGRQ